MSNTPWYEDAIFYHIYPLGLSGAPTHNQHSGEVEHRLDDLYPWIEHAQVLGTNAIYLGPVFQSSSHGYDTIDYYQVDRRLGDNQTLVRFSDHIHQRGMKLVLDGVFNHVGRDFWAFKDVLKYGINSAYVDWFYKINFDGSSPFGDPFSYEAWNGHYSLVKLNLDNPHVRDHLFDAIKLWMDQFGIDGLRLDAADSIDFNYLKALQSFVKSKREDFWLMGEVVHGDYRNWVNAETLDSVTNYEIYKGLYSSLNDNNYFEIAHSLGRQFGKEGLYQNMILYNFVDNHDVDRVASKLNQSIHLYPLYFLLFTMPGIPSIYYGSEWGIPGIKENHSDLPLRPRLNFDQIKTDNPHPALIEAIRKLTHIRHQSSALKVGNYRQVFVSPQQFAFLRQTYDEQIIVILNSAPHEVNIDLNLPISLRHCVDLLHPGEDFMLNNGQLKVCVPSNWGKILKCLN